MIRKRKYATVVVGYDVDEPLVTCGHRPSLKRWPWDPMIAKIEAEAKRRGKDSQELCQSCRRYIPFYAFEDPRLHERLEP